MYRIYISIILIITFALCNAQNVPEADQLQHHADELIAKGEFSKAISLQKKALEINIKYLGNENANTASVYQNLGNSYTYAADYLNAIPCLEKALDIDKKVLGEQHPNTIADLYSLGNAYDDSGDHLKAISCYEKALPIAKKVLGEEDFHVAFILQGLGIGNACLGNYQKAISYHEKALAIDEKVLGSKHPNTAMVLQNLGTSYNGLGNYQKAKYLFERAYSITEQEFGSQNARIAGLMESLANSNEGLKDYSNAIFYYEKALAIDEIKLGNQHVATIRIIQSLARTYYIQNNLERSAYYAVKASVSLEKQLQKILSMDEKTRLSWEMEFMHFGVEPCVLKPEQIAQLIVQRKGVVLDSLLEDRALALAVSHDETGRNKLSEIRSLRSQLSKIGFSNKAQDKNYADQLQDQIAKIQRFLSKYSTHLGSTRESSRISVDALTSALSKGECLIDFIQFSDPNLKVGEQSCYGALVIGIDGVPKFVRMDGTADIDQAIRSLHAAIASGDEKKLADNQKILTDKLWSPIASQLPADVKKIYIGPDGDLSFLSFAAMQDRSGKFLSESYIIAYVGSGRDLTRQIKFENSKRIAIFANPCFSREAILTTSKEGTFRSGEMGEFSKIVLPQLPGTQAESDIIQREGKDKGWETSTFSGIEANKKHLLEQKTPGILHLATHGFYLNSLAPVEGDSRGMKVVGISTDTPPVGLMKGVDPMRASGIALTGAQATLKAWSEGKVPDPQDDGILTAEEVSGLNLDGTWLVTLSACESGVGEAKSGEGVFGLRRAFMMAGAQNLLMTLWPVSDEVTPKIMADFYKEALTTHDAAGSLAKVQRDWLVKLRKEKGLLAAVRDAGPFAMVVMANPNAKPLPPESPSQGVSQHQESSMSGSDSSNKTGSPSSAEISTSSRSGQILEFNNALAKADAGDARAQAIVSIYYGLGYKAEKDLSKAAEYASKSAAQNNPLGQYQLGVLTAGGEGVEKDPEKGKSLKVESIEGLNTMADDPYALAALGAMALRGEGLTKDMKKAGKLYRKSADLGYAPAQLLYSMMLTKGVGVSPDANAARKYASMAEDQSYHP